MAYIGTFYVKKTNSMSIYDNGVTKPIAGIMIPPFAIAKRYWFHAYVVGRYAVDPDKHMPYRITAVHDTIPRNVDQTENFQDLTLEDYRTRYFQEGTESGAGDDASWGDADDNEDQETDVDIPGGQRVTSVAKRQRVFHHEKMLGLPRNAMVTGSDEIRYVDEFTRKGTIKRAGKVDDAKMFMVVGGANDPTTTTDQGDHLWGDTSNLSDLSESLTGVFTDGAYDMASGMDNIPVTYPNLNKWLSSGIILDGFDHFDDQYLGVVTNLTVQVKVYTPNSHDIISAP